MRRLLAILKYLPAALCGLLVVAWVVSLFASFGMDIKGVGVGCQRGSVGVVLFSSHRDWFLSYWHPSHDSDYGPMGMISWKHYTPYKLRIIKVPAALLLTTLLPLAIGPFNRFRFPLWTWFAFTAMVAVELAYYLR